MDLHHLEYIVEIANMHGISKAAYNLHITQSTLSQYLSKLESEIGIKLFDRRKTEMVLTAAGELYVDTCKRMLAEKGRLYDQLKDLAEAKMGNFSVGVTPQWGVIAYSHIIGSFNKMYPNIRVSVTEKTATPLIQLLSERKIDLAIIPLEDNVTLPQKSTLIHTEELLLAIPTGHAEGMPIISMSGKIPCIDISALKDEPMIFSKLNTTIRALEENCFASRGITPNVITEINSHPASLIMVENELGSAFVPASCIRHSEKIVYVHAIPQVHWAVVAAFRNGFTPRPSENYFISLFKEYFKSISSH